MWHRTPWVDSERRNWDKLAEGGGGSGGGGVVTITPTITEDNYNFTINLELTRDQLLELYTDHTVRVRLPVTNNLNVVESYLTILQIYSGAFYVMYNTYSLGEGLTGLLSSLYEDESGKMIFNITVEHFG